MGVEVSTATPIALLLFVLRKRFQIDFQAFSFSTRHFLNAVSGGADAPGRCTVHAADVPSERTFRAMSNGQDTTGGGAGMFRRERAGRPTCHESRYET